MLRTRVLERLHAAASYPVVLVLAPAGFGKTTAIRHFLRHENPIYVETPSAPSLDHFMQAFARGCSPHFPEMATPPEHPNDNSKNTVQTLELYIAWAKTHLLASRRTIVIEDLHRADSDSAIATFLERMVDVSKPGIQWVFSSRTRGHLPITKWQAYGDADAPMSADDLRITDDEAMALATSLRSPASPKQVRTWVSQTRGFAVPLAYAIRLSALRGSVAGIIDGTQAVTFDFLAQQLWASLVDHDRTILEIAAFLPPLHLHAYEKIGIENATSAISRLCSEIAFMSLATNGTFSMHDLFRLFVRQQTALSGPLVENNRRDAALRILFESQHFNEAFRLLIDSRSANELAAAIERFPTSVTDMTVLREMAELTRHFPASDLSLGMLYFHADYWSWSGDPHHSRHYSEELLKRQDATSAQLFCAIRAIFRAVDFKTPSEQRTWLQRLPQITSRLGSVHRTQTSVYEASLLARSPATHDGAFSLLQGVDDQVNSLNANAQLDALITVANAYYYLGDSDAALRAGRSAVAVSRIVGDTREAARALNNLGLMLLNSYDPELESIFDPLRVASKKRVHGVLLMLAIGFRPRISPGKGKQKLLLLPVIFKLP
jgi:ATP/maltotriose-dependent transcriptional regulator MalT